jgi:hypothetical protein
LLLQRLKRQDAIVIVEGGALLSLLGPISQSDTLNLKTKTEDFKISPLKSCDLSYLSDLALAVLVLRKSKTLLIMNHLSFLRLTVSTLKIITVFYPV